VTSKGSYADTKLLTLRPQRSERGDLIWECEIRPAVAGRAYARNLEFEKREWTERKIGYWGLVIGDWRLGIGYWGLGTDCSRPAFPGRAFARKGGRGGSSGGRVTARASVKIFANEVIGINLKNWI
jgi:hypothetical protein